MNRRKGWLQTATRAYALKTWADRQHLATAGDWLAHTASQHAALERALQTLASDWAARPDAVRLAPALDHTHRRFRDHLAHQEGGAARARHAAQLAAEAATTQLQHTHATWTLLTQVIARDDHQHAHDARARERQAAADLWLLAQLAKEPLP